MIAGVDSAAVRPFWIEVSEQRIAAGGAGATCFMK
jgi:hypothetical protein